MRNSASGGGTSTVRTSGGKVFVGGQVTCRIVESDPDAYVVTHTANLTRAAGTGAFPRTDAYTAAAAGNAEIVYTLQGPGGKPKITLTLRFKVVPAPPP